MSGVHHAVLSFHGHAGAGGADSGRVIHMDSAEMCTTGITAASSWWSGFSGTNPSSVSGISGAYGRCWQTSNGGDGIFNFPSPTTNHVAFRFRFRISSDTTQGIGRLDEASNDNHFGFVHIATGNFAVQVGGSNLTTSTGGHIALNHWYVIEGDSLIDNTAGQIEAKLYDGEGAGEWDLLETITFSGDTRDGGTAGVCNSLVASAGISGGNAWWDDIIVDAVGEVYGPARIEVLSPNGVGNYSQLTRTGTDTGNNYSQVNELPFVPSSGSGVISTGSSQRDSYTFANRSIAGTPRCVGIHVLCVLSTSAGTFKISVRIAGVDYDFGTFTTTSSNDIYSVYLQDNPATSAAWTDSDINGAEFGILCVDTNVLMRAIAIQVLVQL